MFAEELYSVGRAEPEVGIDLLVCNVQHTNCTLEVHLSCICLDCASETWW